MNEKPVDRQDPPILAEIKEIIDRRISQYKSVLIQTVLIKGDDRTWKNGVTKITFLLERAESVESLDYGNIVYSEYECELSIVREMMEALVYNGVLKVQGNIVPMTRPDDKNNILDFSRKDFITSTSHYWLKPDWATNLFIYEGTFTGRNFPRNSLASLDKPLYPDVYHLVTHKLGIDLETQTGLIGTVLLFLPNYQAKLSKVQIGTNNITLEINLGSAKLEEVIGKVFAQNETRTVHKDVRFDNQIQTVPIGMSPTQLEVCLLNIQDQELIDQIWLRAVDVSTFSDIDESDPRLVELLIQQGEGEQLEFKPGKLEDKDREELALTSVAFTNRSGGRVLVGVKDDGQITGCFENDVENRVTKFLVDRCDPPVKVRVYKLAVEDKPVYVIVVPESTNKPCAIKGRGFYIRHGSNDYPMSRVELDEIIENRQQFPYGRHL